MSLAEIGVEQALNLGKRPEPTTRSGEERIFLVFHESKAIFQQNSFSKITFFNNSISFFMKLLLQGFQILSSGGVHLLTLGYDQNGTVRKGTMSMRGIFRSREKLNFGLNVELTTI